MTTILLSLAAMSWAEALPAPEVSPEHAARLYRIAVYDDYRLDREEYNRRRELGDQVWNAIDGKVVSEEVRAAAVIWFEAAAQAGKDDELPALPNFMGEELETLPVATSGQEDKVELPRGEYATSLDVELPKGATKTGDAPLLSKLITDAFRAFSLRADAPPAGE